MIDGFIVLTEMLIMIRVIKSVFDTQESSDWPDWLLNHAAANYWRVVGDHDHHDHNNSNDYDGDTVDKDNDMI